MSKSLADNPFITEAKDKNGDSWYHQIILEKKEEEIERLNKELQTTANKCKQKENIIKEVREKIEDVRIFGLRSGKTLIATLLNDVLEILDKENNYE